MDRAVVHSSTFSKNQLAMVAGLATLQVIDDEHIVTRAADRGTQMMEALQPLVEKYELLHEVRGMGLMIGLVFGAPERPRPGPVPHDRDGPQGNVLPTDRGAALPPSPDPDPGGGGQRQHHQAAATPDHRGRGDRPVRRPRSTMCWPTPSAARGCWSKWGRPWPATASSARGGVLRRWERPAPRIVSRGPERGPASEESTASGESTCRTFGTGDRVLVTGGAGFIGSARWFANCSSAGPGWWPWWSPGATP